MASSLNEASLEKKLSSVANTQDGIQTLSLWILHHKIHYKKIVGLWLKCLKQAKVSHRLTLYNLANDVIQNSRRKGFNKYVEAFGEVLEAATPLVKETKILPSIQRIHKIWEERSVYSNETIKSLNEILEARSESDKVVADFKLNVLAEKIRQTSKFNLDVQNKYQIMKNMKVDASSMENFTSLKDRSMGQQYSQDFEESTHCLEEYVNLLLKSVQQRKLLLKKLEESVVYYGTQRREVKIVANAYKNFGRRITNLKKKLDEKFPSLPSPLASPNLEAPSPSPSETEEDLFGENTGKVGRESPPSPVSTPEELKFSPKASSTPPQKTASGEASTLVQSSFVVTSMNTEKPMDATPSNSDNNEHSSSLDSRLTNLMENMQKLPPGVFSTLFGKNSSSNRSTEGNSPAVSGTPLSDEPASHGTPVLDETDSEPKITTSELPKDVPQFDPSNLVTNKNEWPPKQPNGLPWGVTSSEALHDIDERIPQGSNIEPMDMDLDDTEMEDAPGAIIESSEDIKSASNEVVNPINIVPIVAKIPTQSKDSTLVQYPVPGANFMEEDHQLLEDTQRLIEQQISSHDVDTESLKYSQRQPMRNNYDYPDQQRSGDHYYRPHPQNNFRFNQNDGNPRGRSMHGQGYRNNTNNSRPYRQAPPRWRY